MADAVRAETVARSPTRLEPWPLMRPCGSPRSCRVDAYRQLKLVSQAPSIRRLDPSRASMIKLAESAQYV